MATIIKVKHNNLRMSPRKVKLVADVIKGMSVMESEFQLQRMNKRATEPILKLVRSASANAKHVYNLEKDQLFIKEIIANQGPTLKRFIPRAFGRATPLRKRSTHLRVELGVVDSVSEKSIKKIEEDAPAAPTKIADMKELDKKEKEDAKQGDTHLQAGRDITDNAKNESEKTPEDVKPNVAKGGKVDKQQKRERRKSFMNKVFNRKVG